MGGDFIQNLFGHEVARFEIAESLTAGDLAPHEVVNFGQITINRLNSFTLRLRRVFMRGRSMRAAITARAPPESFIPKLSRQRCKLALNLVKGAAGRLDRR